MVMCKACLKQNVELRRTVLNDFASEWICIECRDRAVAKYIADQEATRAKTPTLEERVEKELRSYTDVVCSGFALGGMVQSIIAMVREHDSPLLGQTFYDLRRKLEKAESKLAAIRSELST